MVRRSSRELGSWEEYEEDGRTFVRAEVPKGPNAGRRYSIAKRLAERYEVRGFFASGGLGLILRGKDLHTETDVLIKTTLDYQIVHEAKGRDVEGMQKRIRAARKTLQTERRIMVLLKNLGCNGLPNPNDYVFDRNPALRGPWSTEAGAAWEFADSELIDHEPYLVMEQIDGDPAEKLIGKGLEEERSLRIMRQVAYVLRYAHSRHVVKNNDWEIIYQDLKPANVMVGAHDYVSLLDWGGCRLYFAEGDPILAGASTPGYCPPECDQSVRLTKAADSYAFGATLYQMLTGTAPSDFFTSAQTSGSRKALRRSDWNEPELRRRASGATEKFVFACLAEDPKARPQTGDDLYREVSSLLSASVG